MGVDDSDDLVPGRVEGHPGLLVAGIPEAAQHLDRLVAYGFDALQHGGGQSGVGQRPFQVVEDGQPGPGGAGALLDPHAFQFLRVSLTEVVQVGERAAPAVAHLVEGGGCLVRLRHLRGRGSRQLFQEAIISPAR